MIRFLEEVFRWLGWLIERRNKPKDESEAELSRRLIDGGRWLRSTRALFFVLLLGIPLAFSLQSVFREPVKIPTITTSSCPPADLVPLKEVARFPERFRYRDIWVAGRLQRGKARCVKVACKDQKPECCQICQASLWLTSGEDKLRLDGVLESKRLSCYGSNCAMTCGTLKLGGTYALAGKPMLRLLSSPRPRFRLRSLWVTHACPLDPKNIPSYPTIPDPRLPRSSHSK